MCHAQRIRGHQPGSFFNRITHVLGDYVHDTLREMASAGQVGADEDGEPNIAALRDAEAFLCNASVDCEVDMKPLGLPSNTPLRAVHVAGKEQLDWFMHSAYIGSTPGTWSQEDVAGFLTADKLRHANQVLMGRTEPIRREGRGR